MERGLLWLPLLVIFSWLAWKGWYEYQKVEAYGRWAEQFDQAKYDIYAVLGKKGQEITWGKPTRTEPVEVETFSLQDVESVELFVNNQSVNLEKLPHKGKPDLVFKLVNRRESIKVPFTEVDLAAKWYEFLQKELTGKSS